MPGVFPVNDLKASLRVILDTGSRNPGKPEHNKHLFQQIDVRAINYDDPGRISNALPERCSDKAKNNEQTISLNSVKLADTLFLTTRSAINLPVGSTPAGWPIFLSTV